MNLSIKLMYTLLFSFQFFLIPSYVLHNTYKRSIINRLREVRDEGIGRSVRSGKLQTRCLIKCKNVHISNKSDRHRES